MVFPNYRYRLTEILVTNCLYRVIFISLLIRIQDRLIKRSMNEWEILQKGKELWLMKL